MWNGKGTVSGKWKRRGRRRERPTPDNITCPPSPSLIGQYLPPNNEAQKKVCVSVEPHHQNSKRIKPHTSSHSPTIPIYTTFWTGNYFSLFSLLTYYYSHTPHVMSHDMDTCIHVYIPPLWLKPTTASPSPPPPPPSVCDSKHNSLFSYLWLSTTLHYYYYYYFIFN